MESIVAAPDNDDSFVPIGDTVQCIINDNYCLGHKDAEVSRLIIYSNTTNNTIPVSIQSKPIAFPFLCDNFLCTLNGKEVDIKIQEKDYLKKIIILTENVDLKKNEKFEIHIKCRWKGFVALLDYCHIFFSYPDKSKYTLAIDNFPIKDKPHFLLIDDKIVQENTHYHINENSIVFSDVYINLNKPISVKIIVLHTPKELPLTTYYSRDNSVTYDNYIIILIQHLLSDVVHLVDAFHKNGANKDHIFIVGIPYSTKEKTIEYLSLDGYKNIQDPKEYPFDDIVEDTLRNAIEISDNVKKKILIVEDGGYAVPIIHKRFTQHKDKFVGAVEQTANGIWRDKELVKHSIDFEFPIINVAESDIKAKLESSLIGKAVARNIELLLSREYSSLSGKVVGLVGFGRTGSEIAKMIRSAGGNLIIYDTDTKNLTQAKNDSYEISESHKELVKGCYVIIEASGHKWCKRDELLEFQHGSYYLSASSKRLGIDYEEFNRLSKERSKVHLPGIGAKYTLINDRTITLLADGYPINFFIGESVPDKSIAFILALLYKSAAFLVNNKDLPNAIIDVNDVEDKFGLNTLQSEIADMYSRLH